ncbi:hypothetical protein HED60_18075 [Planctomycetales bacterium ZRK34]|nr:hypothetical protein HED60_18075 [Planctomycetales bacterium ZRK34]
MGKSYDPFHSIHFRTSSICKGSGIMIRSVTSLAWIATIVLLGARVGQAAEPRRVISLDGIWQVAEGAMNQQPANFDHTVPVPGLLDMADPKFDSPGVTVAEAERRKPWTRPADPKREAFWYRRTFKVNGALPEVARLKINKACYGTQVTLNGHVLGEHMPNFTPGWFNARPYLKGDGAANELIVRVGASTAQQPPYLADGWDSEKSRYIPGIYDSVELILSGAPHVVNVQTVPDVEHAKVRAVVELDRDAAGPIKAFVREAKSGRTVGETTVAAGGSSKVDLTVAIEQAHPWSPEDPFLYELFIDTGGDVCKTRFGLRTFTTDPESGRAVLNGRPYFMRGSNVCILRFFEDDTRENLPWDPEWVRALFRRFKQMHWNSLRFCIGFPPELWYRIADEEGMLIQDEFPIWYGGRWPKGVDADHLAIEYTEWMRDHWNHPCVVIWDAQNESHRDGATAGAIAKVRSLDLSNRPWDNGYGAQQQPGDFAEMHPYRSGRRPRGKPFSLSIFLKETGVPNNGARHAKPPYIINEYGWLWVNRDGSLPTLTRDFYHVTLGDDATIDQRRLCYARMLAAMTEFWRTRRKCAGVLEFCGLGYSRPDGQTSDHWIDVKNLIFEPHFAEYVSDAFAPVGLSLEFWDEPLTVGEKRSIKVIAINDLYDDWTGAVRLRLWQGDKVVFEATKPLTIPAIGTAEQVFEITAPPTPGDYTWEAALIGEGQAPVRSLRDAKITALSDS